MPLESSTGGQNFVHPLAAVQVTFPPFSEDSMYSVRPCPLTRTVPSPGTLVALTVADAGAAAPGEAAPDELAGALGELLADVFGDEDPQAAAVATAPRTRPPYSSRRAGAPLRRFMRIVIGEISFARQHCAALRCFPLTTKTRAEGIGRRPDGTAGRRSGQAPAGRRREGAWQLSGRHAAAPPRTWRYPPPRRR